MPLSTLTLLFQFSDLSFDPSTQRHLSTNAFHGVVEGPKLYANRTNRPCPALLLYSRMSSFSVSSESRVFLNSLTRNRCIFCVSSSIIISSFLAYHHSINSFPTPQFPDSAPQISLSAPLGGNRHEHIGSTRSSTAPFTGSVATLFFPLSAQPVHDRYVPARHWRTINHARATSCVLHGFVAWPPNGKHPIEIVASLRNPTRLL